ncbi:MAG: squalene synthase HpnC [Bryobacter sp.]|nr:squalene synthase HpnC [Bryobacter sp.]
MGRAWSLDESLAYTKWIATGHYENFHVVSFLLPKELHQDFYNVYAYCRWADDLGDEIGDTAESLRLLGWWREQLWDEGQARHPVFVALRPTMERRGLSRIHFENLIRAFEQDQTKTRYRDWAELEDYCVYSANPVGRLVLELCGYRDEARAKLSDATCTGLQLANFWQDVSVDLEKGRIYLPLEVLARHGVSEAEVQGRRHSDRFAAAMREAVEKAREYFRVGKRLVPTLDPQLALDIALFNAGGEKILDKVEQQGYAVLDKRPKIGKGERVSLLLGVLAGWAKKRIAGGFRQPLPSEHERA